MKRIMTAQVNGRRRRGRQKKRRGDMIIVDEDNEFLGHCLRLKKENTGGRKKWRRKIRVADHSPGSAPYVAAVGRMCRARRILPYFTFRSLASPVAHVLVIK